MTVIPRSSLSAPNESSHGTHAADAADTGRPASSSLALRIQRAWAGPATLVTADGYPLGVTRLRAKGPPAGIIIVAGAIGVPQRFYRRFTKFVQRRGYDTVTFDYRGIARSAPTTLRGFRMDFRDWGRLDLAEVIADTSLRAQGLNIPVYLVGHSFGGHAFGMSPNHDRVRACFTYGMGAGWDGWMTRRERMKVLALWRVVGPLLTRWKGFLPWSMIGMGEDLPMDVYQQWRRWCQYPRFFLDDPDVGEEMRAQFAQVQTPICAASSVDDAWSPPRSRDAILTGYGSAPITRLDFDPATLALGALGHMGFFRPAAQSLWPAVIDWLESAA